MPARADLSLAAGDLLLVVVDVDVVPCEALVLAVLAGGVALQRPGDGDLVFTGGLLQVGQGGVASVDQVLGRQELAAVGGQLEDHGELIAPEYAVHGVTFVPLELLIDESWRPVPEFPNLSDQKLRGFPLNALEPRNTGSAGH